VVPGIDNAFEHGHAVSTSIFWFLVDTRLKGLAGLAGVPLPAAIPRGPEGVLRPAGIN
jgi:hypothetical protein